LQDSLNSAREIDKARGWTVKDHWLDLDAGIYSYQGVLWETCKTQKRIYELKDVSGSWMKNDRTHLLPLSRGGQEALVKVEPAIGTVSSRSSWGEGREDQRDREGVLDEAGLAGERPDTEEGRPAARVQRRSARSKRRRRTGGLPATGRGQIGVANFMAASASSPGIPTRRIGDGRCKLDWWR
jgi:hypothetical protein